MSNNKNGTFRESLKTETDTETLEKFEDGEVVEINMVPIKEISFKHNNGFGAYECEVAGNEDKIETFGITGVFVRQLDLGQTYKAKGVISTYRSKKQLKIDEIKKIMPKTKKGIISFLQSLNGIGYVSELIYEEYGEESLNMIKNHPLELISLAPILYEELVLDWKRQIDELKDDYDYMIRLMNLGLKSYQAKELYDVYGERVFLKLEENPYFLAREIKGYSFLKCDKIAQRLGIHPDNEQRLMEGIIYYLKQMQVMGDTRFSYRDVIEKMKKELSISIGIREMNKLYKESKGNFAIFKYGEISFEINIQKLSNSIDTYNRARYQYEKDDAKMIVYEVSSESLDTSINLLSLEERLILDGDYVYLREIFIQETQIASNISTILKNRKFFEEININELLDTYLTHNKISLEDKQREAVLISASTIGGALIVNGGAGCGKTFSVKIALNLLEEVYKKRNKYFEKIMIAPTGRASKVLEEATGIPAFTIHRALGYNPSTGYKFNSGNRLPYDCIIIDEASMLDTELAYHLFNAISPYTKVIIMGDIEQLPSIGAGNVLRDLINSKKIPTVTLNVIKRQGLDSGIVLNARNIIEGKMVTTMKDTKDSFVLKCEDYVSAHEKLFMLMGKFSAGYDISDIQILTPQKTGTNGTHYLNYVIQEQFNPDNNDIRFLNRQATVNINNKVFNFDLYFKKGDKVIHITNNYTVPWYYNNGGKLTLDQDNCGITNGETGVIVKLIESKNEYGEYIKKIVVKYNDKYVVYTDDFSDLEHSYALTIHKSQGSEWPVVIMILNGANRMMLERNLLYTGHTRAKNIAALIGDVSSIMTAINTQKTIKRKTGLKEKLMEFC